MRQPLKMLLAEDNAYDAELLLGALRRSGYEPSWVRVDTEADYVSRLNDGWDLIISDYEMPQFSGLRALELLRESRLEIPFIIVSGTIGEDTAVAAMKQGAADYLLKDRLGRVGSAVGNALTEQRLRLERSHALKALKESEERLRNIFDGIAAFVGFFSIDGRVLEINQAAMQTAQLRREDLAGRLFIEGPWWVHSEEMRDRISAALVRVAGGESVQEELLAEVVGGQFIVVEATFSPLRDASGQVVQIVASGIDVTKRKQAEQKIREQLNELLRWQEAMLNREDRVQALKAEVNELLIRQQQPERYSTQGLP